MRLSRRSGMRLPRVRGSLARHRALDDRAGARVPARLRSVQPGGRGGGLSPERSAGCRNHSHGSIDARSPLNNR